MSSKNYFYFGFLDFLPYYVPGVFVLFFLFVLDYSLQSGLTDPFRSIDFSKVGYVTGAILIVLSVIIPYVLGHMIFPVGYKIGRLFKDKSIEGIKTECQYLNKGQYCTMESFDFAECFLECMNNAKIGFNELIITRFRTLSRFCRAMLLPLLLLAISFFSLCIMDLFEGNLKRAIVLFLFSIAVSFSFIGFGHRYIKYEMRWRNGVCISAGKVHAVSNNTDSPEKKTFLKRLFYRIKKKP